MKAGGKPLFYITLLFQLLFTVTQVLTNLWLSSWSSDQPSVNGTMDADLVKFRVGIYGALGIGQGKAHNVSFIHLRKNQRFLFRRHVTLVVDEN